jgi:hypothetical protein
MAHSSNLSHTRNSVAYSPRCRTRQSSAVLASVNEKVLVIDRDVLSDRVTPEVYHRAKDPAGLECELPRAIARQQSAGNDFSKGYFGCLVSCLDSDSDVKLPRVTREQ